MKTPALQVLRGCAAIMIAFAGAAHAEGPVTLPPNDQLPKVPDGFEISVFAREPLLYKPTSICFDAKGRAMVGQGPQYHLSDSIKDSDSVVILLDTDSDGVADKRKVFATGFNSIQGLAWKGDDLYVANSPELTVVRDLDGDDVADEYVVVFTDLGNHEHALHGLVWGPDGRLYMSKGNSKGHNQPEKFGRVAPKAFRELWDVEHPKGAPDIPPPQTYSASSYRSTYHDPHDDWGRQGGVLRCDPLGGKLEIVSRGMRNPWDIDIDAEFNLLGTDNDQTQGDRIIMPFFGAHFGWGHKYSAHWTGAGNLPTVPVSGPMTSGSWAGIAYYDHPHFPAGYRDVFLINDWLFGTYVYRPGWNGALRTSADDTLEPFIQHRDGGMIYRPTDLAIGPDGAVYSLGWGGNYHYEPGKEGSWVFRVSHSPGRTVSPLDTTPLAERSIDRLLNELGSSTLPARRVNAQDELVRRGASIAGEVLRSVATGKLTTAQQTWAVWAVGRIPKLDTKHLDTIRKWAAPPVAGPKAQALSARVPASLRLQSMRVQAFRAKRFGEVDRLRSIVAESLRDADPRIRFEAVQAVHQAGLKSAVELIVAAVAMESDRVASYACWQALRDLASVEMRRSLLKHQSSRVRLAALLGLQEDYLVTQQDVLALVDREDDPVVQSWALTFAQNPTPPAKLSNQTLRIEMEQIAPIGPMLDRVRQEDRPQLRRLYLQMIAWASVSEGSQQKQLLQFYRTMNSEQERAILLPAASTTLESFPDLWQALGETEALQNAAVQGFTNLHRLRVKQLNSSENEVQATDRTVSSVDGFAMQIAALILRRLEDSGPRARQIPGALRVLNSLPLPADWSIGEDSMEALLAIVEARSEASLRRQVLRLLGRLQPGSISRRGRVIAALGRLCLKPDAFLYRDLEAVKSRHGLELRIPKPVPATIPAVLSHLERANAERGRELFFDRIAGAGCVSCHRVRGQGSDVAPDLSGVGLRLTPKNLIRSIIEPSAAITEGYAVQLLQTDDGRTHSGAVIRETNSTITLLRSDGTRESVEASSVESRKRLKQSVMPNGYDLFGAEQLADLTAWLLTLRDGSGTVTSAAGQP